MVYVFSSEFSPVFSGVPVARSLVFCVVFFDKVAVNIKCLSLTKWLLKYCMISSILNVLFTCEDKQYVNYTKWIINHYVY
jgi:hypothetical protein